MVEPPAEFRLPPNAAPQRQQQWWWQMYHWLAQELDRQNIASVRAANAKPRQPKSLTEEERAIAAARHGDPEPLQKLYPQFADCICAPNQRRGRKKNKNENLLKIAYDFSKRIRKLLQKKYDQQNNPPRDDPENSAEAFAAAICREWFGCPLTTDDLLRYKPSGKHKQPRRKKSRAN
jgi:hypothetical protein